MSVRLLFANFEKKSSLFKKLRDNKLAQLAIKIANILKPIYKNIIKI